MNLRSFVPVGLVGSLLVLTGCFEVETRLVVKANGKVEMAQSMRLTPGFMDAANQLSEMSGQESLSAKMMDGFDEFSDADAKLLKKQGIKLKKHRSEITAEKGPDVELVAQAKSLAALDYVGLAAGEAGKSETRRVRMEKLSDGNVKLVMRPSDPPDGGKDAQPDMDDQGDLDPEKMGAIMGQLMAESQKMKLVHEITVPGQIVSAEPDVGMSIDGSTVSWTFGTTEMMSAGPKLSQSEGFSVVFTPSGKLKASLFD